MIDLITKNAIDKVRGLGFAEGKN